MNIIKTFSECGKSIDVYGSFEKPLFHANKLGGMLGFVNIRQTLSRMEPEYLQVTKCDTLGGPQKCTFLTESGLYYLLMRSNKEECKAYDTSLKYNKKFHKENPNAKISLPKEFATFEEYINSEKKRAKCSEQHNKSQK